MSIRSIRLLLVLVAVVLVAAPLIATDVPLRGWTVPSSSGRHLSTLGDISSPSTFVAVTPCRVADTRVGFGFTGAYGPPALTASVSRNFNIVSSSCSGIPAGASAFSLNLTVVNTAGPGFIFAWPTGGATPAVSTLNYVANQTLANAAIVPAGTSGSISVMAGVSNTDLVIDINGYFLDGQMNDSEYLDIEGSWSGGGVLYVENHYVGTGYAINSWNGTGAAGAASINAVMGGTSTAKNWGIKATNSSTGTDSAGVLGISVAPTLSANWAHAGLRGESTTGNGVLGFTACTGCVAMRGDYVNSSGTTLTYGMMGVNTGGVVYGGGLNGTGTKSFVEPHPTDATKAIKYICLEGPEAGTYFRGRGRFVNRVAHIDVPENFRMVTDPEGLTVQITPLGRMASVGVVSVGLDGIEAEANRDVEFSFLVQGVRKAYANENPIVENLWFRPRGPEDKIPAYLSADEQKRLVDNGTYNSDGSVNMRTAERVGWTVQWAAEAEARRQAGDDAAQRLAQENVQKGGGERLLH